MSKHQHLGRKRRRSVVYAVGLSVVALLVFIIATNVIGSRARRQLHERLISIGVAPNLFSQHDAGHESIDPDPNGAPFYRAAFQLVDSWDVLTEELDTVPYVGGADAPELGVRVESEVLRVIDNHLQAKAISWGTQTPVRVPQVLFWIGRAPP